MPAPPIVEAELGLLLELKEEPEAMARLESARKELEKSLAGRC